MSEPSVSDMNGNGSVKSGFSSIHDSNTFHEKFANVTIDGVCRTTFGDLNLEMLSDKLFLKLLVPMVENLTRLDTCVYINNEKARYFHVLEMLSWIVALQKVNSKSTGGMHIHTSQELETSVANSVNSNSSLTNFSVDENSIYITHENTLKSNNGGGSGPVEFILMRGNTFDLKGKKKVNTTNVSARNSTSSPASSLSRGSRPPTPVSRSGNYGGSSHVPSGITSIINNHGDNISPKIAFIAEIKALLAGGAFLDEINNNPIYQLYSQLCVAVENNRRYLIADPVFGVLSDGFDFVFVCAKPHGLDLSGPIRIVRSVKLSFCTRDSSSDRSMKPTNDTRLIVQYFVQVIHGDNFNGQKKSKNGIKNLDLLRSYSRRVAKDFVEAEKRTPTAQLMTLQTMFNTLKRKQDVEGEGTPITAIHGSSKGIGTSTPTEMRTKQRKVEKRSNICDQEDVKETAGGGGGGGSGNIDDDEEEERENNRSHYDADDEHQKES